jgi:hypothetical protein
MARKKIREYMAKLLVLRHLNKYAAPGTSLDQGMRTLGSLMVTTETNFRHFRQETPEFATSALVVKPDMLFGKRGKHNLVLVNKDLDQCEKWIYDRMDQEVQVGHVKGKLTHFLIEKFVPHKDEYYLALTTDRQGTQIKFSVAGGIEVEENWDKVKTLSVPLEADIEQVDLVRIIMIYISHNDISIDMMPLKGQRHTHTFPDSWAHCKGPPQTSSRLTPPSRFVLSHPLFHNHITTVWTARWSLCRAYGEDSTVHKGSLPNVLRSGLHLDGDEPLVLRQ